MRAMSLGGIGFCLGTLCVATMAVAAEPVFQAGFAERDITPTVGMKALGGDGNAYLESLHDPCKVRAAVFGIGPSRVALVGIDALFIRRLTVLAARREIQEKCGIAPEAVLIACSHTHDAGPIGFHLPGEFDEATPLVKSLVYDKGITAHPEYLARVQREIVAAVVAADAGKVNARGAAGFGHEDKAAFNRRFRMRSGVTMTFPGPDNPDILEPAGPIDPQVGVLGAWNADGKFLGCVILDAWIKKQPIADVEVQAVQVGPVVLLACPAECFCQLGLDLKAGSKFPFTFPVALANDAVGYVPTAEAFSPRGGGYETRLTSYSNLEPTAGKQIVDALLGLAGRLQPGAIPLPPPIPKFQGQPGSYGCVPPELD